MTLYFTRWLKYILRFIPISASAWTYKTLLSRKPLKKIADKIIKSVIPDRINIEEGILTLNQNDVGVSGMLALGLYESYQTEIFRNHLKKGMIVVDIGANIGYYSIIAAKRVGEEGKVFAYEPENENLILLEKNIEINSFNNIIAIKVALSNQFGTSKLYLTEDNKGTHSLIDNRQTNNSVAVGTDTLDHSLEQFGFPKIDLIKMDIEGAEILALDGFKRVIDTSPNLIMFIEFYPNAIRRLKREPIELLNNLKELGFSISVIDEDKKKLVPLVNFNKFIDSFPKKTEVEKNLYVAKYNG